VVPETEERFGRYEPPPPDEWDRLAYFLERTLGPGSAKSVRLVLTGDKHFYARHEPIDDPAKPTVVVAGGGGAYLASTLEAPEELILPWQFSSLETTRYRVRKTWPDRSTSGRAGFSALWRIPWHNPELGSVFGVLYTLFGLAAWTGAKEAFAQSRAADDPVEILEPFVAGPFWRDQLQVLWGAMHNVGAWVATAALGLALFAMAKAHRRAWVVAIPAASFHLLLHGVASTAAVAAAARLTDRIPKLDTPAAELFRADDLIEAWPTASFAVFTGLIGAGLGLVAFALYLVLMQFFRVNLNELFVGMRSPHYKHFLRMQVSDERIVAHIVGVEKIPDCDLEWVDGRPVVDCDDVEPSLIDTFTVAANVEANESKPDPAAAAVV
jgi:hypothetical protein